MQTYQNTWYLLSFGCYCKCCWYSIMSLQSVWFSFLRFVSMPEALSQAMEGFFASRNGSGGKLMLLRSSSQSLMTDVWCIYSPAPTGVCVLYWSHGIKFKLTIVLVTWLDIPHWLLPLCCVVAHCLLKIFTGTNS